MAADRDSEYSSPFDAMLDNDRKRLDQLYQGSADDHTGIATKTGSSPSVRSRPSSPAMGRKRAPTDPAQILDERYGGGWRHEVVERRRDNDDMVVLCRLAIAAHGIDLTRPGRARIDSGSVRPEMVGSVDGIPFSFRSKDVTGADGATEDAVERAVLDALAKCIDAI